MNNPYAMDPNEYVRQALSLSSSILGPQGGGVPANSYGLSWGQAPQGAQAVSQYASPMLPFAQLQQQIQQPGGQSFSLLDQLAQRLGIGASTLNDTGSLLQQLINDPRSTGVWSGMNAGSYTPPMPAGAWRGDFNGANGPGQGLIAENKALFPGGAGGGPVPQSAYIPSIYGGTLADREREAAAAAAAQAAAPQPQAPAYDPYAPPSDMDLWRASQTNIMPFVYQNTE